MVALRYVCARAKELGTKWKKKLAPKLNDARNKWLGKQYDSSSVESTSYSIERWHQDIMHKIQSSLEKAYQKLEDGMRLFSKELWMAVYRKDMEDE